VAADAIETTMRSTTTMTDNTENDAKVLADDQPDKNAGAGETPKSPAANRVKIRNTTKTGRGFVIVGGVHIPEQKKPN
jgi:hypothetical protein